LNHLSLISNKNEEFISDLKKVKSVDIISRNKNSLREQKMKNFRGIDIDFTDIKNKEEK